MLVAIKSSPAGTGLETLPHWMTGQLHNLVLLLLKGKRIQKAFGVGLCKDEVQQTPGNMWVVAPSLPTSCICFWSDIISSILIQHSDSP